MREIKFRGVSHEFSSPRWVYGDLICNSTDAPRIMDDYYDCYESTTWLVAPDTVGQFTGLYDANGREIYEGDIVKRDNTYFHETCPTLPKTIVGVVEWCDGEFIVRGSYKLFSSSEKFPITVIGNVHDNPELLEQKP